MVWEKENASLVRLWLTNIFLATKVSRNDFPNIRKSLESSLERLNRSSVDLLQLHGSSFDDEHIDTILKAAAADQLDELKAGRSHLKRWIHD